jgi:hypothetical protein
MDMSEVVYIARDSNLEGVPCEGWVDSVDSALKEVLGLVVVSGYSRGVAS